MRATRTRCPITWALLALGLLLTVSCGRRHRYGPPGGEPRLAPEPKASADRFPVTVPSRLEDLGLSVGTRGLRGEPEQIACRTCHVGIVPSDPDKFRREQAVFHTQIQLEHGTKTCQTCHRPPLFDDFNLADGAPVGPGEVMRLCGQCHARRLVEYRQGAHGGMNGYWDLTRGPRTRNHCLDCHDAHHPAIEQVRPSPRALNR